MISRTRSYLLTLVFFSCVMRRNRILICWSWLMVLVTMVLGQLLKIGGLLSAARRTVVLIGWKCGSVSNMGILRGWGWPRISRPKWRIGKGCHTWGLMKWWVRRRSLRLEWWLRRSEQCRLFISSLSLTVEKMVEVEKISQHRKWFGIDLNIRDLFLDHPGIFYLSTKGKRHTVFFEGSLWQRVFDWTKSCLWCKKKKVTWSRCFRTSGSASC